VVFKRCSIGTKCTTKIPPTPLHHHQPEPLRQGRMIHAFMLFTPHSECCFEVQTIMDPIDFHCILGKMYIFILSVCVCVCVCVCVSLSRVKESIFDRLVRRETLRTFSLQIQFYSLIEHTHTHTPSDECVQGITKKRNSLSCPNPSLVNHRSRWFSRTFMLLKSMVKTWP